MREDEAYLEIAQRYLESCERHIQIGINLQEVIGFKTYHAFESLGGAFNSHFGHVVPRSHNRKINAFVANSRFNRHVNDYNIAIVAMLLTSMRNKFLYPEINGGSVKNPKDQISLTDVHRMVTRVRGICRQIEGLI